MPRGGYRPGAGRKEKPEEDKTQKKSFSLPMDVLDYLKKQDNASAYVTRLIREDIKKNSER